MTDPATISALVAALAPLCRKEGIRRIRVGEIELEFGSGGPVDQKLVEDFQRAFDKGMPSDEDALFHSVPGYVPASEREPEPKPPKTARGGRS